MIERIEVTECGAPLLILYSANYQIASMMYAQVYTSGNNVHFVSADHGTKASLMRNECKIKFVTPMLTIELPMLNQVWQQAWALVITMTTIR